MEFIDALCLTDKRVTRVAWLWRYNLMTGTVMLAMTDIGPGNRMAALSNGQADASRDRRLLGGWCYAGRFGRRRGVVGVSARFRDGVQTTAEGSDRVDTEGSE